MNKKELKAQYKQMKPDMGIFIYKCKPTGKIYIGYGQNIKADINSITFRLNLGNFITNSNLQSDWKAHGAESFEMIVLETLSYDKDESKTDYTKDLQSLREMVAERFGNYENIN